MSDVNWLHSRALVLTATVLTLPLLLGLTACAARPRAQIDWLNVVQFGGIQYVAPFVTAGRAPAEADLGPVFDTVRFRLDRNVYDPNYRTRDGDAAYLDAGTPVYTVEGYATTFRLAAHFTGRLVFYEANYNPRAHTGADLLDIGGKVRSIGVNSEQDGTTELGAIRDLQHVSSLVSMVLMAPVDWHHQESTGAQYFIAFYFEDGTGVARNYWTDSGQLSPGILLPPAFRQAVEQALGV